MMKTRIIVCLALCFQFCFCFSQQKELRKESDGFTWYLIKQGNNYGVQDKDGKTIISLSRGYTGLRFCPVEGCIGYYEVKKDNYLGACDIRGKEILPVFYNYLIYSHPNGFVSENYQGKYDIGIKLPTQKYVNNTSTTKILTQKSDKEQTHNKDARFSGYVSGIYFYKRVMIIQNGKKIPKNDDAHYIRVRKNGCFECDENGDNTFNGFLYYVKNENNQHCFYGSSSFGYVYYYFSYDYSQMEIRLSDNVSYIYQREDGKQTTAKKRPIPEISYRTRAPYGWSCLSFPRIVFVMPVLINQKYHYDLILRLQKQFRVDNYVDVLIIDPNDKSGSSMIIPHPAKVTKLILHKVGQGKEYYSVETCEFLAKNNQYTFAIIYRELRIDDDAANIIYALLSGKTEWTNNLRKQTYIYENEEDNIAWRLDNNDIKFTSSYQTTEKEPRYEFGREDENTYENRLIAEKRLTLTSGMNVTGLSIMTPPKIENNKMITTKSTTVPSTTTKSAPKAVFHGTRVGKIHHLSDSRDMYDLFLQCNVTVYGIKGEKVNLAAYVDGPTKGKGLYSPNGRYKTSEGNVAIGGIVISNADSDKTQWPHYTLTLPFSDLGLPDGTHTINIRWFANAQGKFIGNSEFQTIHFTKRGKDITYFYVEGGEATAGFEQ